MIGDTIVSEEGYIYPVFETDAWHSSSNYECKGIYTSKEEAVFAIAENHNIPLEEFNGLSEEDARERLIDELKVPFETYGYSVNYVIETWLINDWE